MENQLLNQQLILTNSFFGDSNQKTLESYKKRSVDYFKSVQPHHEALKRWIDTSLEGIAKSKREILEIGSATPRDATYMRNKGFNVECTDAVDEFLQLLISKGEMPFKLNILTDPLPRNYDMIFANAVLQHMSEIEVRYIFQKVFNSLTSKALFSFSLKQGFGEYWITEKFSEKRFVKYWQTPKIELLLKEQGFDIIFLESNIKGDLPNHRWINIIAQKP